MLGFSWKEKLKDKVTYEDHKYWNGVYPETGILVDNVQLDDLLKVLSLTFVSKKPSLTPEIFETKLCAPSAH
ncbi:MAG: hypothetical protein V4665_00005 [Patescibacteria group bacterium]